MSGKVYTIKQGVMGLDTWKVVWEEYGILDILFPYRHKFKIQEISFSTITGMKRFQEECCE